MKDVYKEVTDAIIAELEKGVIPWKKPWSGVRCGGAFSFATGRPYSIINQLMLRKPGAYITFNQCKALGGNVKKGAKAHIVVFWKVLRVEIKDADGAPVKSETTGESITKPIPLLKYFQVFHVDDCEGLPEKYLDVAPLSGADSIEAAERVFAEYIDRERITFEQEKSDRAFYRLSADLIHLPLREQFSESSEYYSTLFHEATHSTGHKKRLDRFAESGAAAAFGGEDYSKEELVAEIGAACICNDLGIDTESSFKNSAGYIQGWLRALKNDKKLIVSAAGKAEKAARMILNIGEGARDEA